MATKKHRLVTRADFDGIVSGALLYELDIISDVAFAEPGEMQDGKFAVTDDDITTNLPYIENVYLCLDHHSSEIDRVGKRDNLIIDGDAPSASRVVYDYFGGEEALPNISKEMLDAVDKADSAQYTEEDIFVPDDWTKLNFILDPRTGLNRFGPFQTPNEQFMKDMMVYCRHHPVEEILKIPDVEERLRLYEMHEEFYELQLTRCSTVYDNLVVINLLGEDPIYAGNRFTVYGVFPACSISIQVLPHAKEGRTVLAVGKSITNRTSKTNVGKLMLEYGGGGHKAVGTCRVDNDQVDQVLGELIARITADG
jgi:nanoRNase/pAp phosphatase (c-di-AMP/oligoRNAs hydrolase)